MTTLKRPAMSLNNTNVTRYVGYMVNNLPQDPEIAVYSCRGKLYKWIPEKWINIATPDTYFFHDLKNGKEHSYGSRKKEDYYKEPVKREHKEPVKHAHKEPAKKEPVKQEHKEHREPCRKENCKKEHCRKGHCKKDKPCKKDKCCGETIVRCLNIGCERIITVPVVGFCPKVSKHSEIRPISITAHYFTIDVSAIPCLGCAVLTYKSKDANCCEITVNQIISRPCSPVVICPTLF